LTPHILMGATLGRLFCVDYDINEKITTCASGSIDYAVVKAWEKAERVWPLDPTKTIIRIVWIQSIGTHDIRVVGPDSAKISNLRMHCCTNNLESPQPDYIIFKLNETKQRIFLADYDRLVSPVDEKTLITLPAGTRLITSDNVNWLSRSKNILYQESDIKTEPQSGFSVITLEKDTQMSTVFRPREPFTEETPTLCNTYYHTTTMTQLYELRKNMQNWLQ